jgi:hypothetical protein
MANTIPSPVSSLGDSFDVAVLDSSRVTSFAVGIDVASEVVLSPTTTLITIAVGMDAVGLSVCRGESFDSTHAWPLLPGYHPFGIAAGSTLQFVADAETTVAILEN